MLSIRRVVTISMKAYANRLTYHKVRSRSTKHEMGEANSGCVGHNSRRYQVNKTTEITLKIH